MRCRKKVRLRNRRKLPSRNSFSGLGVLQRAVDSCSSKNRAVEFQVPQEGSKASKLDWLIGQATLDHALDSEQTSEDLATEMEAEFLKDWALI